MVVEVLRGALEGVSNFVSSFFNIIGGAVNPLAAEGLIAIVVICFAWRLLEGGSLPKVPKINRRKKEEDDEDDWEYIRVRRRR